MLVERFISSALILEPEALASRGLYRSDVQKIYCERMLTMSLPTWRDVVIENARSMKLSGCYLSADVPGAPTLVICHGFTGSKEGGGKALEMAEYFTRAGFDSLLFDFAGNGESEGRWADITLSGQIDDLTCCIDWCLERGSGYVVTLGRSFGGTTAICQAATDTRVRGVCTWAASIDPYGLFRGFADPKTLGSEWVALNSEDGTVEVNQAFLSDLSRHDVLQAASCIPPRPLLILHGDRDEVVTPSDAEALYNAAGDPRELHLLPQADHRFSETSKQAWELTLQWLLRISGRAKE